VFAFTSLLQSAVCLPFVKHRASTFVLSLQATGWNADDVAGLFFVRLVYL
jgi:hypothetical protein